MVLWRYSNCVCEMSVYSYSVSAFSIPEAYFSLTDNPSVLTLTVFLLRSSTLLPTGEPAGQPRLQLLHRSVLGGLHGAGRPRLQGACGTTLCFDSVCALFLCVVPDAFAVVLCGL
jgi:hypothetical protein